LNRWEKTEDGAREDQFESARGIRELVARGPSHCAV